MWDALIAAIPTLATAPPEALQILSFTTLVSVLCLLYGFLLSPDSELGDALLILPMVLICLPAGYFKISLPGPLLLLLVGIFIYVFWRRHARSKPVPR